MSSATRRGRTTRGGGPATCRRGRRCRPIPARGLVYIPTNGATIDYYGGFRPGDNLFSTSVIALDVKTGKRVWHQQLVKHDIWNYDTPTAPMLLDVNVGGRRIPGLFQITKQSCVYSFNRHTGEPIWPMEMRPAPQSKVPGREAVDDAAARDQAGAVRLQGRKRSGPDRLHAGDQEAGARARARSATCWRRSSRRRRIAATPKGKGPANICPGGGGGANITGPPAADPASRHHLRHLDERLLADASGAGQGARQRQDDRQDAVAVGRGASGGRPRRRRRSRSRTIRCAGIPDLFKGPFGRIVAIDMNTGEHLWMIPHGDTAQAQQDAFRNNPLLKGVNIDTNWGRRGHAGDGRDVDAAASPRADGRQHAAPVRASTRRPASASARSPRRALGQYGLMTYLHQGKQYIVLPSNGGYTTLALP